MASPDIANISKNDLLADLESSLQKSWAIQERLDTLTLEQYPTQSAEDLIGALKNILKVIVTSLKTCHSELEIGHLQPTDGLSLFARTLSASTSQLSAYSKYIEFARTEDVPWGISFLIDGLVVENFGANARFLLRARPDYNYSYNELLDQLKILAEDMEAGLREFFTDSLDVDQIVEDVESSLGDLGDYFIVVSFPAVERDNILHQCLLLHEVGHFLDEFFNISRSINISMDSHIPRPSSDAGFRVKRELLSRAFRWVKELTADQFALGLVGPAFLSAFEELTVNQFGFDEYKQTHPPVRMRLDAMLKRMEGMGSASSDVGSVVQAKMIELEDRLTRNPEPALETRVEILSGTVMDVVDEIIDEVESKLGNNSFDIRDHVEEIEGLKTRICWHIAPNERVCAVGKRKFQADPRSILNAGWLTIIDSTRFDVFCRSLNFEGIKGRWLARKKISDLVKKALDSIEFQAWWAKIRERLQ